MPLEEFNSDRPDSFEARVHELPGREFDRGEQLDGHNYDTQLTCSQDCMELLLPMAAKKLDLSFDIEPDVPPWMTADYARIRQGQYQAFLTQPDSDAVTLLSAHEPYRKRGEIYCQWLRQSHLWGRP